MLSQPKLHRKRGSGPLLMMQLFEKCICDRRSATQRPLQICAIAETKMYSRQFHFVCDLSLQLDIFQLVGMGFIREQCNVAIEVLTAHTTEVPLEIASDASFLNDIAGIRRCIAEWVHRLAVIVTLDVI